MMQVSHLKDPTNRRSCIYIILPTASLFFFIYFLGGASRELLPREILSKFKKESVHSIPKKRSRETHNFVIRTCSQNQSRPAGSETLPSGIVVENSNLEQRPLWGSPKEPSSQSLFVVTVGIKQKETVDKMVKKFLSSNFSVMLFHYDGIVEGWSDLEWSTKVVHVSALHQTKWWFSKRFLHPNIVSEYNYIFLWDEDLGVENFDPGRYLSIIKEEGLEISQPALDIKSSEVHHLITARAWKSKVHRRIYKKGKDVENCDDSNNAPPCTGWIEVMAPVFSRAAWRCTWYMIQNDMIHAWGLDMKLGYCAQGDRTKNIGVVDAEYIVHYGVPSLGDPNLKTMYKTKTSNFRVEVRRQSYREYKQFLKRWNKAAEQDKGWKDPYT